MTSPPPYSHPSRAQGTLTGDLLVGESQDTQGLQRLLEELSLLAGGGRGSVGEEAVLGARLQEEVGCRGRSGG